MSAFNHSAVSNSQTKRSCVMNAKWVDFAKLEKSAQRVLVWELHLCVCFSYTRVKRQAVYSVWGKRHCFKKSISCNYRAYSNSTLAVCRASPGSTAFFISNLPSSSSLYRAKFRVSKITWNQHILSPAAQPTSVKLYCRTLGFKWVPLVQCLKCWKEGQRGRGEDKHSMCNRLKSSSMSAHWLHLAGDEYRQFSI